MLSTIMSLLHCFTFLTLTVLINLGGVTSVELTFELPDSAKECFHEIIEKDVESTLEFQVSPSSTPSLSYIGPLCRLLLAVITM